MSRPIISVENLGKSYCIGLRETSPDTMFSAVSRLLKSPFTNLRAIRRLNTFHADTNEDDLFWALREVSFEVNEGEVIGIIGRNGAGKSTLLKILSQITEPTTGRAVIRGRVSSLLEVGTGFHPELTGRENIYMNGTILGMSKREIDRKFDEIVDFSGVEKFLDTPVKRYSSGMQVRLAFSVAAHLEPEILIIDEVLAVGDAEFQNKCLGRMKDVASGGRTVLFVSHNMVAVKRLCSKGALIADGQLVEYSDVSTVVDRHLTKSGASLTKHLPKQLSIVRRIQIRDSNGHNTSNIPLGSDAIFEFTVAAEKEIPAFRLLAAVSAYHGELMFTMGTNLQQRWPIRLKNTAIFCCRLSNCRLTPGTYSLGIVIQSHGTTLEAAHDVVTFQVTETDIYGTGLVPSSKHGLVQPEIEWNISCVPHPLPD